MPSIARFRIDLHGGSWYLLSTDLHSLYQLTGYDGITTFRRFYFFQQKKAKIVDAVTFR